MMEKFAGVGGLVGSEFLDLNHTSNSLVQVTLMISKFAPEPAPNAGELRNRDTWMQARVCLLRKVVRGRSWLLFAIWTIKTRPERGSARSVQARRGGGDSPRLRRPCLLMAANMQAFAQAAACSQPMR